jgi:hypothetical protein
MNSDTTMKAVFSQPEVGASKRDGKASEEQYVVMNRMNNKNLI